MNFAPCLRWATRLVLTVGLAARLQAADRFDSLYFSEVLADNREGLKDENGDRSGWLEICHGGRNEISLEGWFLTDNPTNLTQWRFPKVGLLPGKHLLVFASGKDRTNVLAPLHANFRLTPRTGYLALVNRATNVVAEFTPTPQPADVAEGRTRGEPQLRGALKKPTPGKPNSTSGPGFAPEVHFSRPSGNFVQPISLELTASTSSAVIRYTLDGTLPTSASPVYAGPLRLTNSANVRARAYQDRLLPGPPASAAYLRLATNALAFTSTLPVILLDTLGKQFPVGSRSSAVRLSLHEPVRGGTSLTNPPTLAVRGGFRARGSSSAGMPQTSFALDLLDEFDEDEKQELLGLPAESEWVLYGPNEFEPTMIHNPFVHQLSRDIGRYSPRTRFVEVFLVRSDGAVEARHYHGIYVLLEKVTIGKQRVAIDRLGPADLQPPAVTGGYLLKVDRLAPGEQGFGLAGRSVAYVDPKEDTIFLPQREPQRRYLQTFLDDFERALEGPDWRDPVKGYPAYLEVGAALDFHLLQVLSGSVDYMSFSTFFHLPRGGKLTLGPHWDFDRALSSTDGRTANPSRWNVGPFFDGPWMRRVLQDVDFWQLWVDRWQELRQAQLSQAHLEGLIDRLTDELREAQPRQTERWGVYLRGGSYQSEISFMKAWLSNRVDFIEDQLAPAPRLNQPGGRVPPGFQLTLTAPTGATIYYTLDGSDPRLSQGATATNAVAYTGPISLQRSTRIVARAHDPKRRQRGGPSVTTPWSGPVRAKFLVLPP